MHGVAPQQSDWVAALRSQTQEGPVGSSMNHRRPSLAPFAAFCSAPLRQSVFHPWLLRLPASWASCTSWFLPPFLWVVATSDRPRGLLRKNFEKSRRQAKNSGPLFGPFRNLPYRGSAHSTSEEFEHEATELTNGPNPPNSAAPSFPPLSVPSVSSCSFLAASWLPV
jgi:hypothetical protein